MGSAAFPFDRCRAGTLAFCVILYTVLYTCRLNLSAALHALAAVLPRAGAAGGGNGLRCGRGDDASLGQEAGIAPL